MSSDGDGVTLVALVYRDMRWLVWCMEGVRAARTETPYRWLVVANDAEPAVMSELQDADFNWIDHRNVNPEEYYINRVYRAWNRGVLEAPTQRVVMLNSDMWPHDYWLDELLAVKRDNPSAVPTSLLVESGRIPSGIPEYARNFGESPESFDRRAFGEYAESIRNAGATRPGGLYMPMLVDRREFIDAGMYPEGNPPGTTGDKALIVRFRRMGLTHVTALGSVVYHVQEGEMRAKSRG